jgi:hypothetical protein
MIEAMAEAHNKKLCWICKQPRGRNMAFIVDALSMRDKVATEPPSHLKCAMLAAMQRQGETLIYVTRTYILLRANAVEGRKAGVAFHLDDPDLTFRYVDGEAVGSSFSISYRSLARPCYRDEA